MATEREPKRHRPVVPPVARKRPTDAPAPRTTGALGPKGGNAYAALAATLDGATREPLPYLADLERTFGTSLAWITRAVGVREDVLAQGARGAATAETVAFADPTPSFGLVAHEVAHVLQHRVAGGSGDAEAESHAAREHAESGASEPFVVRARAAAPVQLDTEPPPHFEEPDSIQIGGDAKTTVPSTVPQTITLTTGGVRQSVTIEQQIASAQMVSVYAIPLEDTFPTPEAAAEARDKKNALHQPFQVPRAKAAATPPAKPPATTPPAAKPPVAKPLTPAPPPPVPAAPVPATTPAAKPGTADVVYDLAGAPITLIDRAAGFGFTHEFTKLAVGSAACGVLRTPDGDPILVDAGATLTPSEMTGVSTTREKFAEHTMRRIRELVPPGSKVFLAFTHAHLDHTLLTLLVSSDYIIGGVDLNLAQLSVDAGKQVLEQVAEGQRERARKQIRERIRDKVRKDWEQAEKDALTEIETAAREKKFEQHLKEQVESELAKAKLEPVKVTVTGPGPGGTSITYKLPGIEIVPVEATPNAAGTYVAKNARGSTIINLEFAKGVANPPTGKDSAYLDKLESNFMFEFGDGGRLLIFPDIRAGDIVKDGAAIVDAVTSLHGGKKGGVALIDIGHHLRKSFFETTGSGPTMDHVTGLVRASDLAELSSALGKIASSSKGAYVMTSSEARLIDPAVVKFLELSGLTLVPTLAGETQFVSAITAMGERAEGFASGKAIDMESAALLQRTDLTLEKLKEQHSDALELEKVEIANVKRSVANERKGLEAELAFQELELAKAKSAFKDKPWQKEGQKSFKEFRDERTRLRQQRDATAKRLSGLEGKQEQKIESGPARKAREALRDKYNEVANAKEKLLKRLVEESGKHDGKPLTAETLKAELKPEIEALEKVVNPVFDALAKKDELPRLTETSLVLLKQKVARTPENAELIDAWNEAYTARVQALAPDAKLGDQLEYLSKLEKLRDAIQKRTDIADQKAVHDELEFINKQLDSAKQQLAERLKTEPGQTHTDIDPRTGKVVEDKIVSTETTEQAAERQKLEKAAETPPAADAGKPDAAPAAGAAPKPTAYQKFGNAVKTTADVVGRGMGAVMMVQSIKGSIDLIDQYRNDNVTLGQVAAGIPKNLLNLGIGYRMLRGVHVSPWEFMVVSALEVTEALLGDYASTADRNTEVTYALISAGLNTALMYAGTWLMTLGPIGIIAGFIVMAAGEKILDALGVKAWLEKMFDPRPNQIIDADRELQDMVEKYSFTIGSAALEARDDATLHEFGAKDPAAVREALEKQLGKRREKLLKQEVDVVDAFDAAYKRAKYGYYGLKWLDDQRSRFLALYVTVHKNESIPEAGTPYLKTAHWYSLGPDVKLMMGKQTVFERLKATEGFVSLSNATEDDVRDMEQWSKIDTRISEVVGLLYHDTANDRVPLSVRISFPGLDVSQLAQLDWMKVFEAIQMLEQMIANARYRLAPSAQGTHRVAPLLPDGPPKQLYERLLLQYENRIDTLRERVLVMSMGSGAPTGLEKEGEGFYLGTDELGLPALQYDIGSYYEPTYGDTTKSPTEEALLKRLAAILSNYDTLVATQTGKGKLPDGVALSTLKSNIDVIHTYRKALLHDDRYKNYILNLQAAREATVGVMERAHRLLDASPTAKTKLAEADTGFKNSDDHRKNVYAHYFSEELPELEQRVGMTHAMALSTAFGDYKTAPQMTPEEHAAATDDKMLEFHLGTIRDRALKAGIVMPINPKQQIGRLFAIQDRHDVIVAVAPDTEIGIYMSSFVAYETYEIIPINDAAVTYIGGKGKLVVPLYKLVPLTLENLGHKETIGDATLREKPGSVKAAEKIVSWMY